MTEGVNEIVSKLQKKDVYCTDERHMPPIDNRLPVNRNSLLNS